MKGSVFDIQRYSIHDGGGIRTVVFLKGCPLRCRWCSNPESQAGHPEVFYIKSRCIGCRTCVHSCPNGEVEAVPDPGEYASSGSAGPDTEEPSFQIVVHHDRCIGDLSWVKACPAGALRVKGEWMESREVFEEILKDEVFYRRSKGGVTLSGGEPLLQPDFAEEILSLCRGAGISTAVETTGDVPWEIIDRIRPLTDLFLYDMKAMDTQVHRTWTGRGNEQILENLRKLAKAGARIMVRTPLIPGVNDREEDILKILAFLKECGITHYDILPFHQMGSGKYESIGIPYTLAELKVHEDAYVEELRRMIEEKGFDREIYEI